MKAELNISIPEREMHFVITEKLNLLARALTTLGLRSTPENDYYPGRGHPCLYRNSAIKTRPISAVTFYADEAIARRILKALREFTRKLQCVWGLRGEFVELDSTQDPITSWTLESRGFANGFGGPIDQAWFHDLSLLITIFEDMAMQAAA